MRSLGIKIFALVVLGVFGSMVFGQPDKLPVQMGERQGGAEFIQCAGSVTGDYNLIGHVLAGNTDNFGMETIVQSGYAGTQGLLTALVNGECDGITAQSDGQLLALNRQEVVINQISLLQDPVLDEPIWAFSARSTDRVKDVKNMNSDNFTIGFVKGSGAEITWNAWSSQDSSYLKTNVRVFESEALAMDKLGQQGGIDIYLKVAGVNSLRSINGQDFYLVPITDKDFPKVKTPTGQRVYSKMTISNKTEGLEDLLTPPNKRSPQNLDTLSVSAYVMVSDNLPDDMRTNIREALRLARPMLETLGDN